MLLIGRLHQRNVCGEEIFCKLADLDRRKKSNAKSEKKITSANELKSTDQMFDNKAEIAFKIMVRLISAPDENKARQS